MLAWNGVMAEKAMVPYEERPDGGLVLRSLEDDRRLLLQPINFTGRMIHLLRRIAPLEARTTLRTKEKVERFDTLMRPEELAPRIEEHEVVVLEK